LASPDKTPLARDQELRVKFRSDDETARNVKMICETVLRALLVASPDKPPDHAATHHVHTPDTGKRVRGG